MPKKMKGFFPIKDLEVVVYSEHFIVPGVWVSGDDSAPIKCWGLFTPSKKYINCYTNFLDAKEQVKHNMISKYIKKKT
jgi:hypothetical protein